MKPKVNSSGQQELDKMNDKFEAFQEEVSAVDFNAGLSLPVKQQEPQTKMSTREINNATEIRLKPKRSIGSPQKFNENFRSEWEFQKQYVRFIAEHKELIGEWIKDIWTRPFGGVPAEVWDVPTNKPVWGPRYLAEQIKRKSYTRLKMDESAKTSDDSTTSFYGQLAHDTRVERLTCVSAPEITTVSGFSSVFK